jgi:hypothetical protein
MADQLYLSLWFPNFRFEALPAAMTLVLRQFALVSGKENQRVTASTVYPLGFSESPVYQRIFVNDKRAAETRDTEDAIIENAVAEATEQLHDDMAYEFEMRWNLWTPDLAPTASSQAQLDTLWRLEPRTVRVIGFGLDTPWVLDPLEDDRLDDDRDSAGDYDEDDPQLRHDEETTKRIQQNIEMLLAFTLSVEKNCGISSRLLWTESGEPLAEKLIARLQRLN